MTQKLEALHLEALCEEVRQQCVSTMDILRVQKIFLEVENNT